MSQETSTEAPAPRSWTVMRDGAAEPFTGTALEVAFDLGIEAFLRPAVPSGTVGGSRADWIRLDGANPGTRALQLTGDHYLPSRAAAVLRALNPVVQAHTVAYAIMLPVESNPRKRDGEPRERVVVWQRDVWDRAVAQLADWPDMLQRGREWAHNEVERVATIAPLSDRTFLEPVSALVARLPHLDRLRVLLGEVGRAADRQAAMGDAMLAMPRALSSYAAIEAVLALLGPADLRV